MTFACFHTPENRIFFGACPDRVGSFDDIGTRCTSERTPFSGQGRNRFIITHKKLTDRHIVGFPRQTFRTVIRTGRLHVEILPRGIDMPPNNNAKK
jgi:hypothetical protein